MDNINVDRCWKEGSDDFRRRMAERVPVAIRLWNNLRILRVVNNDSMESLDN